MASNCLFWVQVGEGRRITSLHLSSNPVVDTIIKAALNEVRDTVTDPTKVNPHYQKDGQRVNIEDVTMNLNDLKNLGIGSCTNPLNLELPEGMCLITLHACSSVSSLLHPPPTK